MISKTEEEGTLRERYFAQQTVLNATAHSLMRRAPSEVLEIVTGTSLRRTKVAPLAG